MTWPLRVAVETDLLVEEVRMRVISTAWILDRYDVLTVV
jgi:hypothetical protein